VRNYQGEAGRGPVAETGGSIDDGPDGRITGADNLVVGHQRAQPVGEVDDFRTGDAWEKIFGPAREADDFMGEDRPADNEWVVIQNQLGEPDGHLLGQQPAGYLSYLGERDGLERHEVGGVFPVVIEDVALAGERSHMTAPNKSSARPKRAAGVRSTIGLPRAVSSPLFSSSNRNLFC
jgi:hypothetical protein